MLATPRYAIITLDGTYSRKELYSKLIEYGDVRLASRLSEVHSILAELVSFLEFQSSSNLWNTAEHGSSNAHDHASSATPIARSDGTVADGGWEDQLLNATNVDEDASVAMVSIHQSGHHPTEDACVKEEIDMDAGPSGSQSGTLLERLEYLQHQHVPPILDLPAARVESLTEPPYTHNEPPSASSMGQKHKRAQCKLCHKWILLNNNSIIVCFNQHASNHQAIKQFICPRAGCGYDSTKSSNMQLHMKTKHDGDQEYINIFKSKDPKHVALASRIKVERREMVEKCFPHMRLKHPYNIRI